MRLRLLDLFCKAGGAGMGYSQAGFEVVGVDHEPQPRYPFEFHQADAIEFANEHGHEFDVIHASPPCQVHSALSHFATPGKHVDLIPQTREALIRSGKPYIIENVPGAPLNVAVVLCGSMFRLATPCGAELRRHRWFELNWDIGCLVPGCEHGWTRRVIGIYGSIAYDPAIYHAETRLSRGSKSRTIAVHGAKGRDPAAEKRKYRPKTLTVTGHTCVTNPKEEIRETFSTADTRIAMACPWMSMAELSQAIPPPYTKWLGERLIEYLAQTPQ